MFDAATYVARRDRLKEQMEAGLLLLLGNERAPMNYADNAYPFRQDGSFLYFFGLEEPGLAALIDLEEDTTTLFGHDPTLDEIVWTGPRPSLEEKAERTGAGRTAPPAALVEQLQEATAQGRHVHFLPQYRAANKLKLEEGLGIRAARLNEHASRALIRAVVAQRSVKSEEEVAEIERALEVAREMHTLAMRRTAPGVYEREVAGAVEGAALALGSALSFPITFSVRGEVFHNDDRSRQMQAGELALCDAGAVSPRHYASDITRTMPVSGHFSERQKAIYRVVLEGQQAAIDAIRPGTTFKEIHLLAARHMTEAMKALGFMKGNAEEAVAAGAHAIFFQHGLGHMLGLDVHDMEGLGEDFVGYDEETRRSEQFGLNYLRLARALEPGFVLTVEPGVYFIPQLIDRWKFEGRHAAFINYEQFEGYKGFGGIRIEDDVLVTEAGSRVLGPGIPKEVSDVEAMASA